MVKPPKPKPKSQKVIDVEATPVEDDDDWERCGVPGCSELAMMTVKRCAMHSPDETTGIFDPWKEYKRHVEAAKQLLKEIPAFRVGAAISKAGNLNEELGKKIKRTGRLKK